MKNFWKVTATIVLVLLLSACGADNTSNEGYQPCDSMDYEMPNEVGQIYAFPNAASGPHILSVNEGNQLALGSGDFILYRENISEGMINLFGETLSGEGIRITAFKCDGNISFNIDYFPTYSFGELMLLRNSVNWESWSKSIAERFTFVDDGFTAINIGVLNLESNQLIAVPVGLTIPHNEGWHMPDNQQSMENSLTTFHVPTTETDGALSRIEYVPQPGWEQKNMINITTDDGSEFIIYTIRSTVPTVDLTPDGYDGLVTWLFTQAISLNDGSVIPLSGLSISGSETETNGATAVMVKIPVDPYDPNGVISFLTNSEALVSDDYSPTTNESGFLWDFSVFDGTLNYYFESTNN